MNQYKAFFGNRSIDVEAETSYEAVKKAREVFKPARSKVHLVSVVLVGLAGKQVYQSTAL